VGGGAEAGTGAGAVGTATVTVTMFDERETFPARSTARTPYRRVVPGGGDASLKERRLPATRPTSCHPVARLSWRQMRYPATPRSSVLARQRSETPAASMRPTRPVGALGGVVSRTEVVVVVWSP
jgi:hypothetical protein